MCELRLPLTYPRATVLGGHPLIKSLVFGESNQTLLRYVAYLGALFSPAIKYKLLKYLPGRLILDGLGSSETGAVGNKVSSGCKPSDDEPRFTISDNICVLNDKNEPIKPGEKALGRLAKRGHVPIGYYNAPGKSAGTFVEIDGERCAIPGDLATVLSDGSILLHGRGSTCINTGGEKVFPEEIEAVLKEHPDVVDAVVVGVPDQRFGQKVVAVCESRSADILDDQVIREFCRPRLARYKLPRGVVTVRKIKRSPAGKADYPWARAVAEDSLGETG